MVDSVLSTGLQGVQSGIDNARRAAEDITRATTQPTTTNESDQAEGGQPVVQDDTVSLAESIVDLKVSENQVQASAAVVRTADEVLGTIVDIKA